MAILLQKPCGEYYAHTHTSDGFGTVHFLKGFEQYMRRHNLKLGNSLPFQWQRDTEKWHHWYGENSAGERLYQTKCPVCSKTVYYYENKNGSKVFFDCLGTPWPKHPCTINKQTIKGESIGKTADGSDIYCTEKLTLYIKEGFLKLHFDDDIKFFVILPKNEEVREKISIMKTSNCIIIVDKGNVSISSYEHGLGVSGQYKRKKGPKKPKPKRSSGKSKEKAILDNSKGKIGSKNARQKEIRPPRTEEQSEEIRKNVKKDGQRAMQSEKENGQKKMLFARKIQ